LASVARSQTTGRKEKIKRNIPKHKKKEVVKRVKGEVRFGGVVGGSVLPGKSRSWLFSQELLTVV
jgi:hypothetical protein